MDQNWGGDKYTQSLIDRGGLCWKRGKYSGCLETIRISGLDFLVFIQIMHNNI